jgi:hypothetical protein
MCYPSLAAMNPLTPQDKTYYYHFSVETVRKTAAASAPKLPPALHSCHVAPLPSAAVTAAQRFLRNVRDKTSAVKNIAW